MPSYLDYAALSAVVYNNIKRPRLVRIPRLSKRYRGHRVWSRGMTILTHLFKRITLALMLARP
jgi:hypothetical protein